jgi:glutamate formiminotransferase/formiminotetrahydrofolate cyclodeaminase
VTERLVDSSLRGFSEELASERPVPGGGSASAYAGALAAALVAMVARIASKKAPGEHDDLISEVENLRADLLRLVDDDSAAYARVADAMKLPRSSDAEKLARGERLQSGLLASSRVPLDIARTCRRLLESCERGAAVAPAAAASDIGVAALLAEAAINGAALNVMINLASLKDAAHVKTLSEDLDRAVDGADGLRKRILDSVEARIAR